MNTATLAIAYYNSLTVGKVPQRTWQGYAKTKGPRLRRAASAASCVVGQADSHIRTKILNSETGLMTGFNIQVEDMYA
jgi:hypothetical protein